LVRDPSRCSAPVLCQCSGQRTPLHLGFSWALVKGTTQDILLSADHPPTVGRGRFSFSLHPPTLLHIIAHEHHTHMISFRVVLVSFSLSFFFFFF